MIRAGCDKADSDPLPAMPEPRLVSLGTLPDPAGLLAARPDVLVFQTEPLTDDVEVTGEIIYRDRTESTGYIELALKLCGKPSV